MRELIEAEKRINRRTIEVEKATVIQGASRTARGRKRASLGSVDHPRSVDTGRTIKIREIKVNIFLEIERRSVHEERVFTERAVISVLLGKGGMFINRQAIE